MKPHILLIEDDELLGSSLQDNLIMENYSVDWVLNGQIALAAAQKQIHDLVLLDWMIPGLDGISVLKTIRSNSNVPVLMISAKNRVEDRVLCFENLVDDFLTKPFDLCELLARIQALLRRTKSDRTVSNQIQIGQALFDFSAMTVRTKNNNETLTEKEMLLLKLLITYQNRVLSRDAIQTQIWGLGQYPSNRTIDNIIVKLRKWIEPNPSTPSYIKSHRGVGYSLFNREA